jgi:23S rRNA pseudouridine1911/1915/1917 synthase
MAAKQEHAREAITYFEVLKHFERYTLLKVQIKTGRTHQIRVHLNAYAHPVVGDEVYRPKSLRTSVHLGRLFLHACELGFYDLEGNWMEYKSELPKELNEFLQTLS